jgi:uncharacterized protein (DUF1810 family)
MSGFNELVQSIKGAKERYPEQDHYVTFVIFNSQRIKMLHYCSRVSELEMIDASRYQPNDCTPLYDAIGLGICELQKALTTVADYNVLVTVMTDGMENASKKYSGAEIKKMIENLKEKNWTFTYIGTDHDIDLVADSLSISNKMRFDKSDAGVLKMFRQERYARYEYQRKLNSNEEFNRDDYYNEERSLWRFEEPMNQFYQIARKEIRNGLKQSHWMWFMFPQIQGLGHSRTSQYYAIRDLSEAEMFMTEGLGNKLLDLCKELLDSPETNAERIFGYVDAMKLQSCMTLFSLVENDKKPVFQAVLDKFFNGEKDQKTIDIIKKQGKQR